MLKFMRNLSFKFKLLSIVIPALLVTTIYSLVIVTSLLDKKENLEVNTYRIEEAESLTKAIHFLQVERGLSVGFVSSSGTNNRDKLIDIRTKVDNAINETKNTYIRTKNNDTIFNDLNELNLKRSQIDSLKINSSEVMAYYTTTIISFIDKVIIIPTLISSMEERNIIQAYTHLISVKEQLGQIRANLNKAFIKGSFTEETFLAFGGSLNTYTVNNRKFMATAPKKIVELYKNTFNGEAVEKTLAIIENAKNKGLNDKFDINANEWFTTVTTSIDMLRNVEIELYKYIHSQMDEKINNLSKIVAISIILIIFFVLSGTLISIFLTRNLTASLDSLQQGLLSFFSFLNRESTKAEPIKLDSKDEFGIMAKAINENIEKTRKGIEEDRKLIDETIAVLGEFEQGDLCQRLELSVANPALMQLKSVLNNMASNLENNIDNVLKVLEEYSNYNYLNKVDEKGLKEHLLKLASGVNTLGNAVTNMLSSSLQNGSELQRDSVELKETMESLSTSANEQAASLEETAAAMEEMASNVQNNVHKSNSMASIALETDKAVRASAALAQRTSGAMTDIQRATASINEAVAIIENIAFQTNILSLNAAVEAATAGDAGKGFAVVAQEVRNLANRSAEAAKEIKAMALEATVKYNDGLAISEELTKSFEGITQKIEQTTLLVQDVSNANREQLLGIEQINTAVNQIDQMTQQNARIATIADSIANATLQKASLMLKDASSKEFIGKESISTQERRSPNIVSSTLGQNKSYAKHKDKKQSLDTWESF